MEYIVDQPGHIQLREILTKLFSESEIRILCFDLEVDYDNLPGEGKSVKVVELLKHQERRGLISDVIDRASFLRADISWNEVSKFIYNRKSITRVINETIETMASAVPDDLSVSIPQIEQIEPNRITENNYIQILEEFELDIEMCTEEILARRILSNVNMILSKTRNLEQSQNLNQDIIEKMYSDALRFLKKSPRLDSESSSDTYYLIAHILDRRGEFDRAFDYCEMCIKLKPNHNEARKLRYDLAPIVLELKRYKARASETEKQDKRYLKEAGLLLLEEETIQTTSWFTIVLPRRVMDFVRSWLCR